MGKGKNGCDASLSGVKGEVALLAFRQSFKPYLQARLQEILDSALLVDQAAGERLLRDTLKGYLAGDGGPESWMHYFVADYRVAMAKLQAQEDNLPGALENLASPDLDFRHAAFTLSLLRDGASSAEDRSRYRHALAGLMHRNSDLEEARIELQEDLDDPEVSESRHGLAEQKLKALASEEDHGGKWALRTVPPDVREGLSDLQLSYFNTLQESGLQGNDGQVAVASLTPALSQAGYHDRAINLASRALLDWEGDGSRPWHATQYLAAALAEAGRFDQAIELHKASAQANPGSKLANQDLIQVVELYKGMGMQKESLKAAGERVEQVGKAYFADALGDYGLQLCLAGKVDTAFKNIELADQKLPYGVLETKRVVVDRAVSQCSDRGVRSLMRNRLAGDFFSADKPGPALSVLEEELADPGLSSKAVELTRHKISEVQGYMASST